MVQRMPMSYTHTTTSKQVVKLAAQETINLLRTSPASCHLEGHADFIDLVFYFFPHFLFNSNCAEEVAALTDSFLLPITRGAL